MDLGGALYTLGLAGAEPAARQQLSFFDDLVPEVEGFCDLAAIRITEALGGGQ